MRRRHQGCQISTSGANIKAVRSQNLEPTSKLSDLKAVRSQHEAPTSRLSDLSMRRRHQGCQLHRTAVAPFSPLLPFGKQASSSGKWVTAEEHFLSTVSYYTLSLLTLPILLRSTPRSTTLCSARNTHHGVSCFLCAHSPLGVLFLSLFASLLLLSFVLFLNLFLANWLVDSSATSRKAGAVVCLPTLQNAQT